MSFESYTTPKSSADHVPRVRGFRPRGWTFDALMDDQGSWRSPSGDTFKLGPDCNGPCVVQKWEPVLTKFFDDPNLVIVQHDASAGKAVYVWKSKHVNPTETNVSAFVWRDDADHFGRCTATLSAKLAPAQKAFARACALIEVIW